ncbi:MAG: response regulator transcription factor [Magnetococcales bacterium]|nr:response regulator transcription factor [Magnetococcales bacterium]
MPRILLVDDDLDLCTMLSQYLTGDGFDCEMAHDGNSGLMRALSHSYDALVLDVMMPRLNGFDLVRRLREVKSTPIIMLTARGEEVDSIIGLEIGADDYLAKPCSPQVLAAHLRAVLRRTNRTEQNPTNTDPISVGQVTLYPGSLQVVDGNRNIELTSTEFNLLHLLMGNAGQVISKDTLSEKGLGRKLTAYDRSIDIHISNLRRKLHRDTPPTTQRICTLRGAGYLYALTNE